VQVRGDIAGRARVGVVPPHTADVIALLEDREGGEAGAAQCDAHAQTAEPGTDDRHPRALPIRAPPGLTARPAECPAPGGPPIAC
jgi:hypothetical protein